MSSSVELDEAVHSRIQDLCAQGDDFAEAGEFPSALKKYWSAWDLIPEPRTEWEAATWILVAVGDANFLNGDFVAGRENLATAMQCPDAIGNPFIHLRLGQCEFELGNLDRAADELMRAYMGGNSEIFENDDQKYLEFLQTRAKGVDASK